MISLKVIPPTNMKVPSPNIYDAYNHFMQGETAIGRTTLAQFYRNGIDNPRATLYEAVIERENLNQIARINQELLPDDYRKVLRSRHSAIMKEIYFPKHPMIVSAKNTLNENFKRLYPSKKSQRFTSFILGKTVLPALNKFRCLLKFAK